VFEGDRVVGARFRSGTNEFEERAALVVGADGKNSLVARLVQAPVYNEVPSLTCWYMGYWKDLPADGLEAHWSADRVALVFPTNGGLTLIAVGWKHERFGEVRTDIDNHYRAAAGDMVALRERFADATLVGQYSGMGDLPNFFRKPYGPGWALVGDAGHHKDPMNAKGISDAFQDAELLASAIDAGLSGREPMEESLAGYHSARDARAVPDSEFNMMRARLETWGSPEMLGLRAAVRGDVENARELYKAILGMSPWQQFFAPENLGRIIAGAQAAAAAR
jgi:flavin-dependent dehydrogenase